jgi:hypothetical protein
MNLFVRRVFLACLVVQLTGAEPSLAQRRGSGTGEGVRSSAQTSVNRGNNTNLNGSKDFNDNRDANVNRNVSLNQNVSVNREVNVHKAYYGGGNYGGRYYGGCCYYSAATPAAATARAVATAVVVGSIVNSLPPSCSAIAVSGATYQRCGSAWYQPKFSGPSTTYVVVNAPK